MSKPFHIRGNIYILGSAEISLPYDCCVYLIDVGELILIDSGAGRSFNRLGLAKMPCSQISGTSSSYCMVLDGSKAQRMSQMWLSSSRQSTEQAPKLLNEFQSGQQVQEDGHKCWFCGSSNLQQVFKDSYICQDCGSSNLPLLNVAPSCISKAKTPGGGRSYSPSRHYLKWLNKRRNAAS